MILKLVMNEHAAFNVKDVYLRLDSKHKGYIDATDIRDFLRTRGSIYSDIEQAISFIKVYDKD